MAGEKLLGLEACIEWTCEDFPCTLQTNQSSRIRLERSIRKKQRDYTEDVWEQTLWGEYLRQEDSLVVVIRVFLYFKDQYKYVRRYVFAKYW